jgi:hypothetical protein
MKIEIVTNESEKVQNELKKEIFALTKWWHFISWLFVISGFYTTAITIFEAFENQLDKIIIWYYQKILLFL